MTRSTRWQLAAKLRTDGPPEGCAATMIASVAVPAFLFATLPPFVAAFGSSVTIGVLLLLLASGAFERSTIIDVDAEGLELHREGEAGRLLPWSTIRSIQTLGFLEPPFTAVRIEHDAGSLELELTEAEAWTLRCIASFCADLPEPEGRIEQSTGWDTTSWTIRHDQQREQLTSTIEISKQGVAVRRRFGWLRLGWPDVTEIGPDDLGRLVVGGLGVRSSIALPPSIVIAILEVVDQHRREQEARRATADDLERLHRLRELELSRDR